MKLVLISLMIALLMISPVMAETTVTEENGWKVTWDCVDSLIDHTCYVDVENRDLLDLFTTDKFKASLQFSNGSVSDVDAIISEWGTEDIEIPKCYVEEKTETYNTCDDIYFNGTCEDANRTFDERICNETEIVSIDDWLHVKDKKFDAKIKTKDKIKDIDLKFGETQSFKITYTTPIGINNGYGSVGKIALIDTETDIEYHPWWNSSWALCKNIQFTNVATNVNYTEEWIDFNATDLTFTSTDEIRIVDASCGDDGSEIDYDVMSNTSSSVAVGFYYNITQTDSDTNYSIYYNNTGAASPTRINQFASAPTVNIVNTSIDTSVYRYYEIISTGGVGAGTPEYHNSTGSSLQLVGGNGMGGFYNGGWVHNENGTKVVAHLGNLSYFYNQNTSSNMNATWRYFKNKIQVEFNSLPAMIAIESMWTLSTPVTVTYNSTGGTITNLTSSANVAYGQNWTTAYNSSDSYVVGMMATGLNPIDNNTNRIYMGANYQPLISFGDESGNLRATNGTIIEWRIRGGASQDDKIIAVSEAYVAFTNPPTIVLGSEESDSVTGIAFENESIDTQPYNNTNTSQWNISMYENGTENWDWLTFETNYTGSMVNNSAIEQLFSCNSTSTWFDYRHFDGSLAVSTNATGLKDGGKSIFVLYNTSVDDTQINGYVKSAPFNMSQWQKMYYWIYVDNASALNLSSNATFHTYIFKVNEEASYKRGTVLNLTDGWNLIEIDPQNPSSVYDDGDATELFNGSESLRVKFTMWNITTPQTFNVFIDEIMVTTENQTNLTPTDFDKSSGTGTYFTWNNNITVADDNMCARWWANESDGTKYFDDFDCFNVSEGATTPLSIIVDNPTNTTYGSLTVWNNITVNDTADQCWVDTNETNISLVNSTGNWNDLTNYTLGGWNSTFYCNDTAGNEYTNATTIYFTVVLPIYVNMTEPQNITYNTSTVWVNATLNQSASKCSAETDGANWTMSNSSLTNWSYDHVFSEGAQNATVFCNNTLNVTYVSSQEFFTVNLSTPLGITQDEPTNTTYNNTGWIWTNATINSTASYCWSQVNGTGHIMVNHSLSNNSGNWNHNVTPLNNNTGYSSQIFCNDSAGLEYNSTIEWFTILSTYLTPLSITQDEPTNTTYNTSWIWTNATVNNTADACFVWINDTNRTLSNNSGNWNHNATPFTEGYYNSTIFCNDSFGNNYSSSIEYFTINFSTPIAITQDSPTNTTYNNTGWIWTNATVNTTTGLDNCWSQVNGTGHIMTNHTLSNATGNWGHNVTPLNNNTGYSSQIFCNDTGGYEYNSTREWFTILETYTMPLAVTLDQPANNTYHNTWIWVNASVNNTADQCWANNNETANYSLANNSGNWNLNLTGLPVGAHNVSVICNNSYSVEFNSTIEFYSLNLTTPLDITIQDPNNATYGLTLTVWNNITVNDTANQCWVNTDGVNFSLANNSGNWNYPRVYTNGAHNSTFYCNESLGFNYSTSTEYFTVAYFPTVVTLTAPTNATYYTNDSIYNNATTSIAVSTCRLDNGTHNNTMSNTSATDWFYNQSYTIGGHNSTAFCFNGSWYGSGTTYFTRQIDTGVQMYTPTNMSYNTSLIWINATSTSGPCTANVTNAIESNLYALTQENATHFAYQNYFADGNYSTFVTCGIALSNSSTILFEVDIASTFTTMSERVSGIGELFILYVFGNMWLTYMFFLIFFILIASRLGFGIELTVPIGLLIVLLFSGTIWSGVGLVAGLGILLVIGFVVNNELKQK